MPLFTFLISFFFFKVNFKTRTILGLIIGFLGMIIFINPFSEVTSNNNFLFSSLIILSSAFYAFSANWVKTVNEESSFELACCSIAVASLILIPMVLVLLLFNNFEIYLFFSSITMKSFISATILGIFCTGLAIAMFFYLIEKNSAVFASQSNYMIPCFGFLWSFLFLEESFTINLFVGFLLIVAGGILINKE
jgi:drug/metabolite transporter (DMT)-like permease